MCSGQRCAFQIMKTNHQNINNFLSGAHNCAIQMMQNVAYIQKELPSLSMSDCLREEIAKLCNDLICTKHDLIGQIFECHELLEEDSDAPRIGKMINQMHQWMSGSVESFQECVAAIQQSIAQGAAAPVLGMLVMESAVNIINAVPALPKNREESLDDSEDDPLLEDEDQDDDADRYDPNCYAFHCEDSYPIGQLIATIRKLASRADLTTENATGLKVFLFVMQRLPLVTHGVRINLGLRLDQGGESDWIEIRIEDGEFSLCRGTWTDGDADTETVFEVTPDYRDGDAFEASHFAQSFAECARDMCREIVIDDTSDEPFTAWDLKSDKSRWSDLPCSFD